MGVETLQAARSVFSEAEDLLEKAVQEAVFPGAVLLVGVAGRPLFEKAVGVKSSLLDRDQTASPVAIDTVYDIASLTSVIATGTILMRLVEEGRINLGDRVSRFIQGFSVHGKSDITIEHLLSHSSGLAHWHPYFEDLIRIHNAERPGIITSRGAREYVINHIVRSALKYPIGQRQLYSDLGIMLLGHLIEIVTGVGLDRAAFKYVFQPLGLRTTSFIDLAKMRRRGIYPVKDLIAPTEDCGWRKRVLCGEVHDDNAWAMGGIAGHSGLFSTAPDVLKFCSAMMDCYRGKSRFVGAQSVRQFWHNRAVVEDETWQLGWESPGRRNAMLEAGLSQSAVGQNGFTGCSLWIEPEHDIVVVLMSNRVHPSRSNRKIRQFRPKLFRAVLNALERI